MNHLEQARTLSIHESILMLYGSYGWLDDLFIMQARGSHFPTAEDFAEALELNHALTLVVERKLEMAGSEANDLRLQLRNSSIEPLVDLESRVASRR